jgi:hypothetical protein
MRTRRLGRAVDPACSQRLFVFKVMTHTEYDEDKWKG